MGGTVCIVMRSMGAATATTATTTTTATVQRRRVWWRNAGLRGCGWVCYLLVGDCWDGRCPCACIVSNCPWAPGGRLLFFVLFWFVSCRRAWLILVRCHFVVVRVPSSSVFCCMAVPFSSRRGGTEASLFPSVSLRFGCGNVPAATAH